MMASKRSEVNDVMTAINAACRGMGAPYNTYSCKEVSWDDAQRGTTGSGLSCWGGNITDTRLWAKDGTPLFTVRSDNWNEKLGKVSTDKVALRVGNHIVETKSEMKSVSLQSFLKKLGEYGAYTGIPPHTEFHDDSLDAELSIRFQTTFLPVSDDPLATMEFASEAYNYNTMSDDDPKNLLLLCTTQGTAVQQDGKGAKKLFHHRLDQENKIHRHWLEAEKTRHEVGGPQVETAEERKDALARGKATSELIGLQSMESRFNVLMTIQVPLKQAKPAQTVFADMVDGGGGPPIMAACMYQKKSCKKFSMPKFSVLPKLASTETCEQNRVCRGVERTLKKKGTANAARVSRGTEHDIWSGLTVSSPERHPKEHITVTVVLYNTVAGGVPSEDDVTAAIDDMESLYDSCTWTGRLADDGASFMKKELTKDEMKDIQDKINQQPPVGELVRAE